MTAEQPAAVPNDSGTISHALGYFMFIPVPFLNLVATGLAQGFSYRTVRTRGVRAAAIARSGANWGFTVAIASGALLLLQLIFSLTLGQLKLGFFPAGIPIVFYAFLLILHLVFTITGTNAARKGKVYDNELTLQFYKKP